MLVKKLDTASTEDLDKVLRDTIKQKFIANNEGFFVSSLSDKRQIRTMDKQQAETLLEQVNLNGLIVHARSATTGLINQDNVHGWQIEGWQFVHNGQVFTGYTSTIAVEKDTDSLVLFRNLVKNINTRKPSNKNVIKAIRQELDAVSFWGRAALYDHVHDRMFLIGDWYTYLINNQVVVISSADLLWTDEIIKTHGMTFELGGEVGMELIDGLAVISNFSKPNFYYKHYGKLELDKPAGFGFENRTKVYNSPAIKHAGAGSYLEDDDDMFPYTSFMKNSLGEIVEVMEDETGIHDIYYTCCQSNICNQFTDLTTSEEAEYLASQRPTIHSQPIT